MSRLLTEDERAAVLGLSEVYFRAVAAEGGTNKASGGALLCRRIREATGLRLDDPCLGRCFQVHAVRTLGELEQKIKTARVVG